MIISGFSAFNCKSLTLYVGLFSRLILSNREEITKMPLNRGVFILNSNHSFKVDKNVSKLDKNVSKLDKLSSKVDKNASRLDKLTSKVD